eukprot:gnl/TRDRNA2_/TRDRNA2_82127_c0_seq2.p1 gnl/TRDRNA2_/TRDRNA2_82127_c0~~gnl/TRDRNA2_/TRDRNA2_82127_c0_seq2.p1  ORF type:complete len:355 (+),score=51.26 gnl/TRDRNA2_/TRDRNA2_82127_c0_seq2:95-1159(+)
MGSSRKESKFELCRFQKLCQQSDCKCDRIQFSVPSGRTQEADVPLGRAACYGDVGWVIEGNTPKAVLENTIDASSFRYAFEAGTVAPAGDDAAIGEMVAFNGHAYVRSTRIDTTEYYTTVNGTRMRSPAVFTVGPADAVPDIIASTATGGMTWESAIKDVFETANLAGRAPAVAFGGLVTFDKFIGIAVARSTVDEENIFLNKSKYYPFPPTKEDTVRCVVFGVAGDLDAAKACGVQKLESVLYAGSGGSAGAGGGSSIILHTHVVTLHDACAAKTPQDVRPEDVKDCFHLDSNSVVKDFELELWAITESVGDQPTVQQATAQEPSDLQEPSAKRSRQTEPSPAAQSSSTAQAQ